MASYVPTSANHHTIDIHATLVTFLDQKQTVMADDCNRGRGAKEGFWLNASHLDDDDDDDERKQKTADLV